MCLEVYSWAINLFGFIIGYMDANLKVMWEPANKNVVFHSWIYQYVILPYRLFLRNYVLDFHLHKIIFSIFNGLFYFNCRINYLLWPLELVGQYLKLYTVRFICITFVIFLLIIFQNKYGQTLCISCEKGLTTGKEGSNKEVHCKSKRDT